jgi:hypothetical protein
VVSDEAVDVDVEVDVDTAVVDRVVTVADGKR